MYCFHESPPASRPHPVSLLPPKPAPISAPLVGMLTLTMPQSEPAGLYDSNSKHQVSGISPLLLFNHVMRDVWRTQST